MARNRQRAKQRRAARLADGGRSAPSREARERARVEEDITPESEREVFAEDPALIGSAPPEDVGRSDTVVEAPPDEEYEEEDYDFEDEEQPAPEGWQAEAAGRRGAERAVEAKGREHGRVVTFLINCWAELQRVQWPNRKQVTQLTAIVLGFVLIAGGYLGLLDLIFSELVSEII
jgi:preprotein translocase subunit SecE